MSGPIEKNDLVMVVRPSTCCRSIKYIGHTFTVALVETTFARCESCGSASEATGALDPDRGWFYVSRLIKVDPPEHGDSLPTRADLGVPA